MPVNAMVEDFTSLSNETIYQGRAFAVQRHRMRLPNGNESMYDVVKHIGAVGIVPMDDEGNLYFVRQFRVGPFCSLLEIPAGTLKVGEDPAECAGRELREEIGMGARNIRKLGAAFLAPGYSSELLHFYLATGLYSDPLEGDEDEFLNVEKIHLSDALKMAHSGQLQDGKTLAALLLLQGVLDKK